MAEYAHPEVLVDTDWVADHLSDPQVRLVESNEDILLYNQGHIPGAVKIDWISDLNDPVVRDYLDKARFEQLLAAKALVTTPPLYFMAIRTTGGRPTPSGCSSYLGIRMPASSTVGAPSGLPKGVS